MENKHGTAGANTFVWGLLIGALLTTLITTKRGRQILHDLADFGLEVFEDFAEQKTSEKTSDISDSDEREATEEDLESEITEVETPKQAASAESSGEPKNGNGHTKKRLFKGIRRPK